MNKQYMVEAHVAACYCWREIDSLQSLKSCVQSSHWKYSNYIPVRGSEAAFLANSDLSEAVIMERI